MLQQSVHPIDRILSMLDGVRRKSGGGYMAPCPAHPDRNPSLSIDENKHGDVLLKCFAGCETEAILAALRLTPSDLFADRGRFREGPTLSRTRRVVDRYDYTDGDGNLVYQVERLEPKSFRQRRPDGRGGWIYNLQDTTPILYKMPDLLSSPGRYVNYVEGEKDADRLASLGLLATTTAMGANKPLLDGDVEVLRHHPLAIWADNDKPGIDRAQRAAARLHAAGARVKVIVPPDVPIGGDVSDWLDQGHTKEDLIRLAKETPDWTPESAPSVSDPEPESGALKVPPFSIEAFPRVVRDYVESQARCIGVPVEMIALPLMAFLGSMIGNRVSIKLKSGFHQYASLFVAVIAPPGAAKSPALNAARWALDRLQAEAHAAYKTQLATWETETEHWQAKPKDERGDKPARPKLRHFYTTDPTIEALVGILESAPGVAIVRDELLGWITSMDQYRGGKGSDRQQYLSLWTTSSIKADRRTGEPIYQAHPCASIVGGIQDDFLSQLHDRDGKRDGLIERFLLIRPDVRPSGWSEDELDTSLLDRLVEMFRQIDRALSPRDGAPDDAIGCDVLLSTEARRLWIDWYNENDTLKADTAGLRQGFYSKLPLQVARLALILNTMWNPDDPQRMVSKERMADAIELGEFCRAHFDRTLPLIGDISPGHAGGTEGRVLRVLRIEGEQAVDWWVPRRTILQRLGNVKADDLTRVLDRLADVGTVESRREATSTKPREEWRLVGASPDEHSNNSHNLIGTRGGASEQTNSSNCSTHDFDKVRF